MGPLRDILSFAVFVASFFGRAVEWRGHRYGAQADRTLTYRGEVEIVMRTLFLQAPSSTASTAARLALPGAARDPLVLVSDLARPAGRAGRGSKLIDAPPHGIKLAEVARQARDYDLAVLHTSTPSFASDVKTVEALKAANRRSRSG